MEETSELKLCPRNIIGLHIRAQEKKQLQFRVNKIKYIELYFPKD